VSAIINARYSTDEMQAIINNFLQEADVTSLIAILMSTQNFNKLKKAMTEWLGGLDSDVVAAYTEMQAYRQYAKELAQTIVDSLEEDKSKQ